MDKYFIFKSQDEEVAAVDLQGISSVELNNPQECIKIESYHTGRLCVVIENLKDRNSEFLRLTTAMQKQADDEANEELMFINAFSGKSH